MRMNTTQPVSRKFSPRGRRRSTRLAPNSARRGSSSTATLVGMVVLVFVALIAVNALVGVVVRGVRLDLTEGRVYTLSPGVGDLLRRLDEPVRLDFYYTAEAGQNVPGIRTYAARVREFLEELVAVSGGNLRLRVIDPVPFSEAEDAAKLAGVAALRVDGAGRELMLGLVATNAVDRSETIPFLDPQNEPFLEYEIVRVVHSLGRASRPRVGVLSTLPIGGGFDMATRQQSGPWQVHRQMQALFDLVPIAPSADTLPESLDALMLVHPHGLSEAMLRAIDRHAYAGGRILAFLDPHCESAAPIDPTSPDFDRASDLGPLPEAWGVRFVPGAIVGDTEHAQRVQARVGGGMQVLDYVVWLTMPASAMDQDDPITGGLGSVNMASVGAFEPIAPSPSGPGAARQATVRPLIRSSEQSMRIGPERIAFMPDPAALLREFVPSGRREVLAVRIDGRVDRAFPEKEGEPATTQRDAAIVLVGDADLLRDDFWIVQEQIGGVSLGARAIADNGSMLLNALEMLAGDEALITLRGRAAVARPFERVERIRRAAEARYLAREQALREQINATEQRIVALQTQKGPELTLTLSPEQEREIENLETEVIAARAELRQVQFDLRQDYERLGQRLMLVNVVLWPLLVALVATLWSVRRTMRHRALRAGGAR